MTNYITYLRVSTQQQGSSGLGLEAQRASVNAFARNDTVLAEYVEVESGKRSNNRPQLAAAMAHAKSGKAVLLIAKLDRLARNVLFIAQLMESKVRFVAADMPEADRTMLQMLAVFAEWEARMISERTKAALAAAKARGVVLGCPDPGAGGRAMRARKARINADAIRLAKELRGAGLTLVEIAERLQVNGVKTSRGEAAWHPTQVRRLLA